MGHKLKLQYFAAAEFAADFQLRTHTFETADDDQDTQMGVFNCCVFAWQQINELVIEKP